MRGPVRAHCWPSLISSPPTSHQSVSMSTSQPQLIGILYRTHSAAVRLSEQQCETFSKACKAQYCTHLEGTGLPPDQIQIELSNTLVGLSTGSGQRPIQSPFVSSPSKRRIPDKFWMKRIFGRAKQGAVKGLVIIGSLSVVGLDNTLYLSHLLEPVNGWILRLNKYPPSSAQPDQIGSDDLTSARQLITLHSAQTTRLALPPNLPTAQAAATAYTTVITQINQLSFNNDTPAAHVYTDAIAEHSDRELLSAVRKARLAKHGVHRKRVLELGASAVDRAELQKVLGDAKAAGQRGDGGEGEGEYEWEDESEGEEEVGAEVEGEEPVILVPDTQPNLRSPLPLVLVPNTQYTVAPATLPHPQLGLPNTFPDSADTSLHLGTPDSSCRLPIDQPTPSKHNLAQGPTDENEPPVKKKQKGHAVGTKLPRVPQEEQVARGIDKAGLESVLLPLLVPKRGEEITVNEVTNVLKWHVPEVKELQKSTCTNRIRSVIASVAASGVLERAGTQGSLELWRVK